MNGSIETAPWLDIALRISLSVLAGGLVGVNRDLRGKSFGLRTLGLVSLACCLLVLCVVQYAQAHGAVAGGADSAARVVQGIVSGIGFLGAGAILRGTDQIHVYGITTAAAILVVAAMGVACALAAWPILIVGFLATAFLLIVCEPLEQRIHGAYDRRAARKTAEKSPL
jgi:putative Mg2+ transporter-C (MgtC) family protein